MNRTRRDFIGLGVGGVAAVGLGVAFWDDVFGSAATARRSSSAGYGPRRAPNEHGLRLPEGFDSRVVARGGEQVPGTGYSWHEASDGAATFPLDDGGWILVSNSETLDGGASSIRFHRDGSVAGAQRILERHDAELLGRRHALGHLALVRGDRGRAGVECDPSGRRKAVSHPALGVFKHEAAAVDPRGRRVYLTEDLIDGGFYRFTPTRWPDLSAGLLEIATVGRGGRTRWTEVPDPAARSTPTRRQVEHSTRFKRGEGIWHDDGTVYVSTTGDDRVHAYDILPRALRVVYDGLASARPPLLRVDQLTVNRAGEVFVCEDLATEEIDIGLIDRAGRVSRFLSVTGPEHVGSELTGVTFSPAGRSACTSPPSAPAARQRRHARPGWSIYELRGPFRGRR